MKELRTDDGVDGVYDGTKEAGIAVAGVRTDGGAGGLYDGYSEVGSD